MYAGLLLCPISMRSELAPLLTATTFAHSSSRAVPLRHGIARTLIMVAPSSHVRSDLLLTSLKDTARPLTRSHAAR